MKYGICRREFFRAGAGRRQSVFDYGIEIRGNAEFRLQTKRALALLFPFAQFEIIRDNLAMIQQARCSGMKAWARRPTFFVGKPTWHHSTVWYAGAIAHDAYHAALYADAKQRRPGTEPRADDWTGIEAEKKCLAFQRQLLSAINADKQILIYIDRLAQNPTYQGLNQGWRSWLDYRKRRW